MYILRPSQNRLELKNITMRLSSRIIQISLLIGIISLIFTGCSKNASINSLTANAAEKQAMLGGQVEKFRNDVYWGNITAASRYVEGASRTAFGRIFSRRLEKEKIVEVKVKNVDFGDKEDEAEIILETQYFKKPSLYVSKRFEKQRWAFNRLEGGWLLRNSELIDEKELENLAQSDEIKQSF